VADEIKSFLTDPSEYSNLTEQLTGQPLGDKQAFKMQNNQVEVVPIDITSSAGEGPSRSAWASVRTLESQGVVNDFTLNTDDGEQENNIEADAKTMDTIMTNYIVDVFLVFKTVDNTTESSSASNQAAQEANADIDQANVRGGRAAEQPEPYEETETDDGDPLDEDGFIKPL
jgi:hypothetical protein